MKYTYETSEIESMTSSRIGTYIPHDQIETEGFKYEFDNKENVAIVFISSDEMDITIPQGYERESEHSDIFKNEAGYYFRLQRFSNDGIFHVTILSSFMKEEYMSEDFCYTVKYIGLSFDPFKGRAESNLFPRHFYGITNNTNAAGKINLHTDFPNTEQVIPLVAIKEAGFTNIEEFTVLVFIECNSNNDSHSDNYMDMVMASALDIPVNHIDGMAPFMYDVLLLNSTTVFPKAHGIKNKKWYKEKYKGFFNFVEYFLIEKGLIEEGSPDNYFTTGDAIVDILATAKYLDNLKKNPVTS